MNTPSDLSKAIGVEATGIRRAAVLGAGSMGAGIAAQFANAGVPVDLLDVPSPDASSRDMVAQAGLDRQFKVGGFMHPAAAALVRPGNTEDDLKRLAEADWIVEAVVERLDVKQALYRKIDAERKTGSIVSSNTSTILRAELIKGMAPRFVADFLITHFFNPPRVMRLVEIVSADEHSAELVERTRVAAETVLGKTVIDCRDTPGFIANRIGCYWIAFAILEAKRLCLTVEEADAVNAALGIPRTGVFGLLDLIGIDLVPHVWGSLLASLPQSDAFQAADLPSDPLIHAMIEAGRLGRKAKGGFYRVTPDKSRQVIDLATGEYRQEVAVQSKDLPGAGRDLSALLDSQCRFGNYAWQVFASVFAYAAEHGPEIAGDVGSIDTAITLGYAWKEGPFRMADQYGAAKIRDRFERESKPIPALLETAVSGGFMSLDGRALSTRGAKLKPATVTAPGLAAAKTERARIFGNEAASVWDLGDGVACFEIHTKMNSFAPAVLDMLEMTVSRGDSDFDALVIGNDDPRAFSVGADLAFIADMARAEDWQALYYYISRGQSAFRDLKYAPFPVVSAAHGFALGGGCELMMHTHSVVAHAELAAGLPEVKVGLIPAWGGCTQILLRAQNSSLAKQGAAAVAATAFNTIISAAKSASALDARDHLLLRPADAIAMNRDQLIATAKAKAHSLLRAGYSAPERVTLAVSGRSGKVAIMSTVNAELAAKRITAADAAIAEVLATVLTGGSDGDTRSSQTEEELMWLELDALMHLVRQPATRERINHMLATGKPLQN